MYIELYIVVLRLCHGYHSNVVYIIHAFFIETISQASLIFINRLSLISVRHHKSSFSQRNFFYIELLTFANSYKSIDMQMLKY